MPHHSFEGCSHRTHIPRDRRDGAERRARTLTATRREESEGARPDPIGTVASGCDRRMRCQDELGQAVDCLIRNERFMGSACSAAWPR